MPTRAEAVKEVLSTLGIDISEEEIEAALKSLRPRRNRSQLTFEHVEQNPEMYSVRYNSQTPFEVLNALYHANPEAFSTAFRVIRKRNKQKADASANQPLF